MQVIVEIEKTLDELFSGVWNRLDLSSDILKELKKRYKIAHGWEIDIDFITSNGISVPTLILLIDQLFPHSQPIIVAPALSEEGIWPHAENYGALCSKKTNILHPNISHRVANHLHWAIELLAFDNNRIEHEFKIEFATYWSRQSSDKPRIESLLNTDRPSRNIFFYYDTNTFIVAEEQIAIVTFLSNRGIAFDQDKIFKTWVEKLTTALMPSQFPQTNSDLDKVFNNVPIDTILSQRNDCKIPIIFQIPTNNSSVFVGVSITTPSKSKIIKGLRKVQHENYGKEILKRAKSVESLEKLRVIRVDSKWVHGRDHDENHSIISNKKVACIGCGSLGGRIMELLLRAGVQQFSFVDGDNYESHNSSRHILDYRFHYFRKADALGEWAKSGFPHIPKPLTYPCMFEGLSNDNYEELASSNLVICSGITLAGLFAVDRWRANLAEPPAAIYCWVEPFALVGHALLFIDGSGVSSLFDKKGQFRHRMTHWPDSVQYQFIEAGCGNLFQPHGIVELQNSVNMTAKLALNFLTGYCSEETHNLWLGDKKAVKKLGGIPFPDFKPSNQIVEKEILWS